METAPAPVFQRPAWNQAAIWMGADFIALLRLYSKNGFRVPPSAWLDAAIDSGFGIVNTALRAAQAVSLSRRVEKIQLDQQPIFIIGHWRTGTTLLHELLSLDPHHRYSTTYECFLPNHFLLSERFLKSWIGFALPGTRPPDNVRMGWDLPQEDEFALCNMGVPSPYLHIAFPNEPQHWDDYYELDKLTAAAREQWKAAFVTFLKRMTYKRSGRMLLKSPTHTFRIPTLLELFPQARFIHIIRNPYEVFSSTIKLWQSLYGVHGYQQPQQSEAEQTEFVLSMFTRLHTRLAATRALIPAEHFCEIRYEDLARDPVGQVKSIYERLNLPDFATVEPDLREYTQQHADYKRNRHDVRPELRELIQHHWGEWLERQGYA